MTGKSKFQISRSLDERIKRIIAGTSEYDSEFAQVSSAYILGFNYGNVTNCIGLTTNYQLPHAVFPVVGIVFFKTSPPDDEIKDSLRQVEEFSSSPNGLGSFKLDKNEHLFLIYSVDKNIKEIEKRIFNFTKGTFVRRRRLRLSVLDDPFCPKQIHRGSEDLFNFGDTDSLASADDDHVDHLIFFIHGVGGVCDVRFRSCVEVVADFKKMANALLSQQSNPSSGTSTPSNKYLAQQLRKGFFRKHSTESSTSRGSEAAETIARSSSGIRPRRVECLPVSWHSCTRRQTGMNDQLNLVALSSVPKLRHFLNKVVMDALLYSSGPVYSQAIINNVGEELNRLYTLFMEKHPNFTGTVSLAGHSLGSVIVFDLLAHQIPTSKHPSKPEPETHSNYNSGSDNTSLMENNKAETNTGNIDSQQNCYHVSHKHHDSQRNLNRTGCMNYETLEELLKDMDLSRYAELFCREHIDLNSLILLTDLDLKELNLPLGARRKLETYINFKKVPSCTTIFGAQDNNTQQQHNQQSSSSENGKVNQQFADMSGNTLVGDTEDDNNNHEDRKGEKHTTHPYDNMNTGQYLLKYPQLKFTPKCFFAFGSPMPMFLNIRGVPTISKDYKLPTCDRMYNIFHPYDPLAYRVEPLIDPRFKSIDPVLIPHHRGGKRMHVQIREGFARVGQDIKHHLWGSLRNTWSSFANRSNVATPESSRSPSVDSGPPVLGASTNVESLPGGSSSSKPAAEPVDSENSAGPAHGGSIEFDSTKVGKLNCGRRLDYVLQEKPIELFNEYIFAFTSHASYWQNEDSALMILNELYQGDSFVMLNCFE